MTHTSPAIRTFLIADVRGYTRFTLEHGDEAAAQRCCTFGGGGPPPRQRSGAGTRVVLRLPLSRRGVPSHRDGPRRAVQIGVLLVASIVAGYAFAPQWASAHTTVTSAQRARETVLAYIRAYNHRDVHGVIATLDGMHLGYSDCDYGMHRLRSFHNRRSVARWVRGRIADHDKLGDPSLDVHGGSRPVVLAAVTRTSLQLAPLVRGGEIPARFGFKIILDGGGRKITTVAASGSALCAAGRLPPGAQPERERSTAGKFLAGYASRDPANVVSLLSTNLRYNDCDTRAGTRRTLTAGSAVLSFLQEQFAAGDQFNSPNVVLDSWKSEPPNDPLTLVIDATRSRAASGSGSGASHPVEIMLTLDRMSGLLDLVSINDLRPCQPQ